MTESDITRSSTAIRKGIDNSVATEHRHNLPRLLTLAADIESVVGPILLTSGYRSPALNKAVGGSKTSAHSLCLALDFEVPGKSNRQVCREIADSHLEYDQIINEFSPDGWVHVGLSEGKPRKQLLTATKSGGKTVYSVGI